MKQFDLEIIIANFLKRGATIFKNFFFFRKLVPENVNSKLAPLRYFCIDWFRRQINRQSSVKIPPIKILQVIITFIFFTPFLRYTQ